MNVGQLTRIFRPLRLMHAVDRCKFVWQRFAHAKENRLYQAAHPEVSFPPDYMLFESFRLQYQKYWEGGRQSAIWVRDLIQPHLSAEAARVLDWGCGPARLVRHLPGLLPEAMSVYGTDYNPATIAWCREHIANVHFSLNDLHPPTSYTDQFFHAIYGISVFTHLSEHNHHAWYAELKRIAAPGAVFLFTTHGDAFREKMTTEECRRYDAGQLVVRGHVKEGHRVYTAFHPPAFLENLWADTATVLRHIPGQPRDWGIEQDTWVLKKH